MEFAQSLKRPPIPLGRLFLLAGCFEPLFFLGCSGTETSSPVTPAVSSYIVTSSNSSPVVASTVTITAQAVDGSAKPLAIQGRLVLWADAGTRGTFSSGSSTTDASGIATVMYTTGIGANARHQVLATDTKGATGVSGVIRTVAGPPVKYLVGMNAAAVVLSSSAIGVNALLTDAYGNEVSLVGHLVTWSSTGAGGSFSPTTSLTDKFGAAATTFAASATGGVTHVVTASDGNGFSGSASPILTAPRAQGLSPQAVAVGAGDACMLDPSGAAFCWGWNAFGQLGNGFNVDFPAPLSVSGGLKFVDLVAGDSHTCGISAGGAAYCWGVNSSGQLGDNSTSVRPSPTAVAGGLNFIALAVGSMHTCGIAAGGAAYCWGDNASGELGNGTSLSSTVPVPVLGGLSFVSLKAGASHTCGLVANGTAYCWGYNNFGQLGEGSNVTSRAPVRVAGSIAFTSISTGSSHTCGIAAAGVLYCWGRNDYGQLGDGSVTTRSSPGVVLVAPAFASVSAGYVHTCALTPAGVAYCWGSNLTGELGDGAAAGRPTPARVSGSLTFASVAAGGMVTADSYYGPQLVSETCGITVDNVAYCWGANGFGQLGIDVVIEYSPFPYKVAGQR